MAKNLTTLVLIIIGTLISYNIYRSLNKSKEGYENKHKCSTGCSKHKNLNGNCDDKVYHDADGHYKTCNFKCPEETDNNYDVDQDCENDQDCEKCGKFNIYTNNTGHKIQNNEGAWEHNNRRSTTNEYDNRRDEWDNHIKSSLFGGRAGSGVPSEDAHTLTNYDPEEYYSSGGELSRGKYEAMGRKFLNDELEKKRARPRRILDSEAEVLGRLVWRVSKAQKRGVKTNSTHNREIIMQRETELLQNLAHILRVNTAKLPVKHDSYHNSLAIVHKLPQEYTNHRTTNMFSHIPYADNKIERKEGYKFTGQRSYGHPDYDDLSTAINECAKQHDCVGTNFNSTRGNHVLMGPDSKLVPSTGHVAYVKQHYKQHYKQHNYNILENTKPSSISATPKNDKKYYHDDKYNTFKSEKKYTHYDDRPRRPGSYPVSQAYATNTKTNKHASMMSGKASLSPYTSYAPTNKPRNPNLEPTPYNSLMDLFR